MCLETLLENSGLDGDSCLDEAVAQDPDEPTRLNELVLEAVAQHDDCFRASIGRTACRDLWCQATARARTGGGRTSLLTEQYTPVCLRPSGPQPIAPHDETDRTAELIGEDTSAAHLSAAVADGDDFSHRAIMADQLDPVLSMSEQDRRRHWLRLRPELRKVLRDPT